MSITDTDRFIIQSVEGDADRGGWQATGYFANEQAVAVYQRRAFVNYLPEGGGVWEAVSSVGLAGSILPQSVRFDRRLSQTQVTVSTADAFLNNAGLQGIYFVEDATPTNPHQVTGLTLGSIIQHIIEQHCNISSTAFVQNADGSYSADPVGGWCDTSNIDTVSSTTVDVYTVRQSNSMWQTLKGIAANEFYVCYFNKFNEFNYEVHPQFAASLPSPVMTLDQDNIIGQPEITFRDRTLIDQAVLSALTDAGVILTSAYPAQFGSNGRIDRSQNRLRCNVQARLDVLAERYFNFQNREYNVRLSIPGAWGLKMELYDRIYLNYTGTASNGLSVSFSNEPFWINRIEVQRVGNFNAVTTLTLEQERVLESSMSVA
jgi:hypothetical protein